MKNTKQRLTYDVPEVARKLGVSNQNVYQAIADGKIPAIRLGRRIVIPRVPFDRMLEPAV